MTNNEIDTGVDMNSDCLEEDTADTPELDEAGRRKFERTSHQDKCRLFVETPSGQKEFTAWMLDVSATGVRFRVLTSKLPKRGVMIQLPGMTGKATSLKIVRADELGGEHWEYGARFTGIVPLP